MSSELQLHEEVLRLECANAALKSGRERDRLAYRIQAGLAVLALAATVALAPGNQPASAQSGNSIVSRLDALDARLTAEIADRSAGDLNTLAASEAYANAKDAALQAALDTETARANAAEMALARNITGLQTLTSPLSLVGTELTISGVNVHIINGSGFSFDHNNGLGNLIIGYNDSRNGPGLEWALAKGPDARTGSHNLILGICNNYTSSQAIITGAANDSTSLGSIMAGVLNTASGGGNVVFGFTNMATAIYATVLGGYYNNSTAEAASVLGGIANHATAFTSTVSGGAVNTASANWSSCSGGYNNAASGVSTSITGGSNNIASTELSSVTGGGTNIASGYGSSISGGYQNQVTSPWATVTGGRNNTAGGDSSSVSGGVSVSQLSPGAWSAGSLHSP